MHTASPQHGTDARDHPVRRAGVVVIGAGQAGLSAGYHLNRRGFASALTDGDAERSFVMLDAGAAPGGAWQHRWESLTMATVNGIFDLPGFRQSPPEPGTPARIAVPEYFAAFEERMQLPILRPVKVLAVSAADDDPDGELLIESDAGTWAARAVINATGTWDNPTLPAFPGQETFAGRQLHTRNYASLEEFAGQRVAVVGGGISAIQQLEEISRVAEVFWYTRREPVFRDGPFDAEAGKDVVSRVAADVEAGNPTGSVVSYTGLLWTPYALAAKERGALQRRPMFTRIEPDGVREADGSLTRVDAILWATGFKPSLSHLGPLRLRNERGGIEVHGTVAAADPRVHLIGFGPSQSTVGANRAGREAVRALAEQFDRGARPGLRKPLGESAVGINDLSVDPARRSGQEGSHLGNVFGGAQTLHRGKLRQTVDGLLVLAVQEQWSGRGTGRNRVDGDVPSPQFPRQDGSQSLHGGLAGSVRRVGGMLQAGLAGRDVHQRTTAPQALRCQLGDHKAAADVRAVHPVQFIEVQVHHRGEDHDSGGVNDDVDSAESGLNLIKEPGHGNLVGHIPADGYGLASRGSQLLNYFRRLVHVPCVVDGQGEAVL